MVLLDRRKNILVVSSLRFLEGEINVPGDKSISHRALIFSSIAEGISSIEGAQRGEDCLATLRCIRSLGVEIEEREERILVKGEGLELKEPENVLDCQNSGTTMRIISGLLAGQKFYSVLTGDSSLRKRPMERVVIPLCEMGADIWARKGYFAPLSIKGKSLTGKTHNLKVASAQVKSCLLLAGLYAKGKTCLVEPYKSRDHTERMLNYMGAKMEIDGNKVAIWGGQRLEAKSFFIPGDISSASFFIGGAAILKGSKIKIKDVGVNPTRLGFVDVLKRMGAKVRLCNKNVRCNEDIADIEVEGREGLEGVKIKREEIPRLLDEIPILAVVACFARGKTLIEGAEELRIKESDRIKAICTELSKMGARVEERRDGMVIFGTGRLKGQEVESWSDHRIAMALAVAGICAEGETVIRGANCISISFPDFEKILNEVGKI